MSSRSFWSCPPFTTSCGVVWSYERCWQRMPFGNTSTSSSSLCRSSPQAIHVLPEHPCMECLYDMYIYISIYMIYVFHLYWEKIWAKCRQINHIWTVWVCTDIQNSPLVGDWMERQPPLNNLCIDGTKLTAVVFTERTSLQWTVLIRRDHHQVKRF